MNPAELIEKVVSGIDLDSREMERMMGALTKSDMPAAQIGFFLGALRAKKEGIGELTGAAQALRRHAAFIDAGPRPVIDTCGTGGDHADTFNISTTAAFVAAGAGVAVAKHGNRSISSKCGSADVLVACGFNLDVDPVVMEYAIQKIGIGFLFAPKMHPALGKIAGVRRDIGARTIFNMAAPLANPAGASGQVLGVFASNLVEMYARVLLALGTRRAFVVHGMDGLDEISCCAPTRVCQLNDGQIKTFELIPEMLIGERYDPSQIKGGLPRENAAILRGILDGSIGGAKRAIVLMNAAAAIAAGGAADSLEIGMELATRSLESGAALQKFEQLIEASK